MQSTSGASFPRRLSVLSSLAALLPCNQGPASLVVPVRREGTCPAADMFAPNANLDLFFF